MENDNFFAKNLEAIRRINGQSIAEFAKAVDLPKSTLQSIRLNGNTTLDTAARISIALNLPLDSLVHDSRLPEKLDLVQHVLKSIIWFQALSVEERGKALFHFQQLLEVVGK